MFPMAAGEIGPRSLVELGEPVDWLLVELVEEEFLGLVENSEHDAVNAAMVE